MRNGVRLWFVCGSRALTEHGRSHTVIQQLGKVFSTGREGLVEAVEKQMATFHELRKENLELVNQLARLEGKELYAKSEHWDDKGLVCVANIQNPKDAGYLRTVIKAYESDAKLHAEPFALAVIALIGNRIFMQATCSGSELPGANAWIVPVIQEFGGKGGGNELSAQGSIPLTAEDDANLLTEKLLQCLRSALTCR